MKHISCFFGLIASLGLAATSCSLKELADATPSVSTDKTVIEVESDAELKADPYSIQAPLVSDTVRVTSSRSWSADVKTDDGTGWVSLSAKEHIDAGNVLETADLVLTFSRFKGTSPRTAKLTIRCAECPDPVIIPITQKPYSPKVVIEPAGDLAGIPAEGGNINVVIRSNTSWRASISTEESTVVPSLSLVEGEGTDVIRLEFPSNPDDEQARFAKLVVSAPGCEPQNVEFVQSQSERFFFLSSAVPSEVAAYENTIFIPLRSNGPWTATVSECTFENGRVEPSEGLYAYSGIYFNYASHGSDPLSGGKHALVTIKREGMADIVVEFTQKGSIHLNFGHYNPEAEWEGLVGDDEYKYKPYTTVTKVFSQPESFPYSYSSGLYGGVLTDCITSAGSFTFKMFGSDCGIYYAPGSYCFCVGKKQGDYVEFPAFEGYRLSEMYYEASCRNLTPYTVRDVQGNVITGGEYTETVQTQPISKEYNDMHHHVFTDTKPGAAYRLVLETTLRVISIKDLCLVYEKYDQ